MAADQSIQHAAFRWPVRVYYEDTDAGGVVYHANYLNFLERARTEWLSDLGFEQDRLRAEQGVLFAVRRLAIDYLRPALFNDRLMVLSVPVRLGRASLDFEQKILRDAGGTLCCRARVELACVSADRLRPTRIPDAVARAMQGAVQAASQGHALSSDKSPESIHGI
ncbi:tol-pal system-associated acyl-CoA thioesterase [Thiohalocapsa marina]|uniref:Tol-pal system-associated acyl-CoA thioesterase n=1 Tax=Thiohalocapsa marina TaxID=424902 RepID=A0A5M8FM32_9GAMM|nr:tol-pal system-associated acyl-CoA thioesterase [Thiohalocapsa marina]KAA6185973.1 tol-pal system-associated acyl-CoA thioesterase [Thiohalocapsa marina]